MYYFNVCFPRVSAGQQIVSLAFVKGAEGFEEGLCSVEFWQPQVSQGKIPSDLGIHRV